MILLTIFDEKFTIYNNLNSKFFIPNLVLWGFGVLGFWGRVGGG